MSKAILKTGAALLLLGVAAPAVATPPSQTGVQSPNYTLVIDPDATDRVQINLPSASEYEEDAPISHGTRSPSIFLFQDTTLDQNANTGWHYHPGIVLITVATGSVEWYDASCGKHVRNAGDFFTESDQLHYVRNVNSVPARMIITFIIAKGLTNKIYAPAPPCAVALGLN